MTEGNWLLDDCLVDIVTGATRNAERIIRVLVERLQRLELPAAVAVIRLRAEAPEALPGRSASLFGECGEGAGGGCGQNYRI